MSGSSLDGLDIIASTFSLDEEGQIGSWSIQAAATLPFSKHWIARLQTLPQQKALTFTRTHSDFGHYCADLLATFLQKHPFDLDFIATHGHTVFHHPEWQMSVQIGDGAALAAKSGFPVVCDFRTQDVALGGQGAPIAPIADRLLLQGYDFYLNLGGIANITALIGERTIAFDIGAANQVLNALAALRGLEYDAGGALAAEGTPLPTLLKTIDQLDYFSNPWPKSLDNQWLQKELLPYYLNSEASIEDRLCTACEQLARQIAIAIQQIKAAEGLEQEQYTMLVTGGGAFNDFLMQRIQHYCQQEAVRVIIPEPRIVAFKEALLMALMGVLRVENKANCLQSVTGSSRDSIGGAIYQGSKKII